MRVFWREDLGEVESSGWRGCEGEVVVVPVVVVVYFGDLGETIGKREAEGEVGMAGVVLVVVGDCGLTDAVRVKLGRR
jgi:hypothetical protein